MSDGYSIPGMSNQDGGKVRDRLQQRLVALIDLELTLKHVHWNVVGPTFIGVHEMLDPQVAAVRLMVDELAERIATLGGSPVGTPGYVATHRSWDDYSLLRATTLEHLGALDLVYAGVVSDHRSAIEDVGDLDPVSEDILITQSGQLEQYQWFVRAHLEDSTGALATEGATTLLEAARQASGRATPEAAKPAKAAKAAKTGKPAKKATRTRT
jgi:starvation-inducible DNA-binding protein